MRPTGKAPEKTARQQSVALGRSGLTVSPIALGCVTFGREIDAETSFRIMDHAFEHGITYFDTAEVYGEGASETVVGRWLRDRGAHSAVTVGTKVNIPLTRQHVLDVVERSRERLGVQRLDLFQLHNWDAETPLAETLDALAEAVTHGSVRAIGCSNFTAAQLRECLEYQRTHAHTPMTVMQLRYSLVARDVETDLLPMCADAGIGVVSYSPLAAGFLTGKYAPDAPPPRGSRFDIMPGHQRIYFSDRAFRLMAALRECAADWRVSREHLAIAWAMANPGIHSVLIGARTVEQVDQALQAAALDLTADMKSQLDQISG